MASEPNAPTIRCPGCGEAVKLPAEVCENCGYNFREGKKPDPVLPLATVEQDDERKRKKLYLAGAAIAIVVIIIICVLSMGGSDNNAQAPASPKGATQGLEAPPKASGPAFLRPQVPIGLAKDAAEATGEKHDDLAETYEELESERQSN
ncbi:MAG: hypothetical protein LBE27_05670 [Deltaproteobacteria bacterium]|jgi:hypothetical protein|nr:hypothetical protein [Deltaproteobacteria bacterium]